MIPKMNTLLNFRTSHDLSSWVLSPYGLKTLLPKCSFFLPETRDIEEVATQRYNLIIRFMDKQSIGSHRIFLIPSLSTQDKNL